MKEKLSSNAKQARKEYMHEWRKNNKDKISKSNARYWEKKAREISESENNKNGKNEND